MKTYLSLDECLKEIRVNISDNIKQLQEAYSDIELQRCMLKSSYDSLVNQQARISKQIDALYKSLGDYTPKIDDIDCDEL